MNKTESSKKFNEIAEFCMWHHSLLNEQTTDDELDEMFEKHYTIVFNGKALDLPFHADIYSAINELLVHILEEW